MKRRLWLVASSLWLVACTSLPAGERIVRIAGSSTVQPIVAEAARRYQKAHPDVQIVVGGGGSGHGIQAVGEGKVDLGMSSRDLKPQDKEKFPGLIETRLGIDGIVVIVHASNPLRKIEGRQVVAAFTGQVRQWADLGGGNGEIALITTNERHGTYDTFIDYFRLAAKVVEKDSQNKTLHFKLKSDVEFPATGALAVDGNKPTLAAVATKPNALSYASFGTAHRVISSGAPLAMLDLDGMTPSETAVRRGDYRFQRPLLVLSNGPVTGAAAEFLAYLAGAEVRQILRDLDYIPLSDAANRGS